MTQVTNLPYFNTKCIEKTAICSPQYRACFLNNFVECLQRLHHSIKTIYTLCPTLGLSIPINYGNVSSLFLSPRHLAFQYFLWSYTQVLADIKTLLGTHKTTIKATSGIWKTDLSLINVSVTNLLCTVFPIGHMWDKKGGVSCLGDDANIRVAEYSIWVHVSHYTLTQETTH